jgi:RNA polymerase sigma factor (sigma-70 family)
VPPAPTDFDPARCAELVRRYLQAQGWRLLEPAELAEKLCPEVVAALGQGQPAEKAVRDAVWQRYGAYLHDCCSDRSSPHYQRAWAELGHWLERQAPRLVSADAEQQELVQETLINLQTAVSRAPLSQPYALWVYALQALRRNNIDRSRRDKAAKRGEGLELSLEEVKADPEEGNGDWEERLAPADVEPREVEAQVTGDETYHRLQRLFRDLLATPLQALVAEALFLEGLTPQELATRLGKKPHEIRQLKARIVHALRHLPPAQYQELMALLNGTDRAITHDG